MRHDHDGDDPLKVQLDDLDRIPDLVAALVRYGVRLTRVEPHHPTLEDLYFAVRGAAPGRSGIVLADARAAGKHVRPSSGNRLGRGLRDPIARAPTNDGRSSPPLPPLRPQPCKPEKQKLDWPRVWTIARTDLKQLIEAQGLPDADDDPRRDLLLGDPDDPAVRHHPRRATSTSSTSSRRRSRCCPAAAQAADRGDTGQAKAAYALAVYLLAPVAVVVPLTISTAVGAATIVGERERGTGEFLAHSPAVVREIYIGKLIASLVPGYGTTIIGLRVYSLIVNLIVGPQVGGWFFPTPQWWVLMLWVVPPFLALTLSLVLRLSARVKSTAAAQQASGLVTLPLIMIAYSQARGAVRRHWVGIGVGAVVWSLAILGLWRGMKAVTRCRLLGVADGI